MAVKTTYTPLAGKPPAAPSVAPAERERGHPKVRRCRHPPAAELASSCAPSAACPPLPPPLAALSHTVCVAQAKLLAVAITMSVLLTWAACRQSCSVAGGGICSRGGGGVGGSPTPVTAAAPQQPEGRTMEFEVCNGFTNQKIALLTGSGWGGALFGSSQLSAG